MEYDFRNDWLYLRMNHEIPQEIVDFMVQSFEILEIRQRVGEVKSIRFEVRSREGNHALPHVHASYDNPGTAVFRSQCAYGQRPDPLRGEHHPLCEPHTHRQPFVSAGHHEDGEGCCRANCPGTSGRVMIHGEETDTSAQGNRAGVSKAGAFAQEASCVFIGS